MNPLTPNIDPRTLDVIKNAVTMTYMTSTPTIAAINNGTQLVAKISGNYYLYVYVDGAWRRTQLT